MSVCWIEHASAQKITKTKISFEICISSNRTDFKIIRQRSEMTHQHRLSRSESAVTERAVGEWRQRPPVAFLLEKDILSTCCNKDE